jgi:hypothetical protein
LVATKEIDDKELDLSSSGSSRKICLRLFFIRASFVIAWLSFSLIIFIIAALADINWMRPTLEQVIGQSIHRNVKLGRLFWHFGLHGFSVDASRLLVAERTGEPFLMAGNCEIGFSLWPLLIGVGKIQYVNMQKPLFMAVHTGPKNWNFDDMLIVSPDIDFIQVQGGHIFVVDRQPAIQQRFPETELNDVQIKLERAGHFTPAQMNVAFILQGQKTDATFSVDGKSWGDENEPWWDKKCHVELSTKRFTVKNWQTITSLATVDNKNLAYSSFISKLTSAIPKFSASADARPVLISSLGQFDFHAIADGVPSKKIGADLQLKADNVVIHPLHDTIMQFPETSITAQLEFKPDSFAWNKCVIRVPDYKLLFNMAGSSIVGPDKKQKTDHWSVIGLLGDLKKLNSLFAFVYNNIPGDNTLDAKSLFSNLNGKLFLDLRFNAEPRQEQYSVEAKANEVNIDGIRPLLLSINKLTINKAKLINPFEGKYCKQLNLSKQAQFSGTIIGKSGQGLVLKDCSLKDDEMFWKISGQLDADGQWQELNISNNELQLSRLSAKMNHDIDFARQVKTFLGLEPNSIIDLNGNAQVSARIVGANTDNNTNETNNVSCEIKFDDAGLKLSQPQLDIHHLNGLYASNSSNLSCKNMHFTVNGSDVNIDAAVSANKLDPLRFNLQSKNINIIDLRAILSLFHFETNFLDNWHLTGILTDVDIRASGTINAPVFAITAYPADLVFTAPNLKQSIHAASGKLVYANKVLSLEKVALSNPSSKCLVSLVLKNPGSTGKLEKLSVQINSAELNDVQSYMVAAHLANSQLKKYQITNIKGNVSGFIEYVSHQDKQKLNGLIEFDGLSFRYCQQKLLCKNLKGKILLADSDIVLQDVTGSLDNTVFALHGRLVNYAQTAKDKPTQWRGEVAAQLTPENLNSLLSMGSPPGQKPYFNLQAKKPIFIKLKTYTRNVSSSHSFILMADPDAGLSISAGNLTFNQPTKKLTINGSFALDDQKLTWRNLNFDFSGSSINLQGAISNYRNTKLDPVYDLQIQTSDTVPASYLGQICSNGVINGALTGQIKGNLSLQGSAKSPLVTGKISFMDMAVPDLYLDHIVGTLTFLSGQGNSVPALLQIDEFNIGPIQLLQASGNLLWQNDLSQVSLKNFIARLASGQFTSNALIDLKTKKIHFNIDVNGANLTQLWPQITSSQIKAAGALSCNLNIDTSGSTAKELEQNMVGSGHVHAVHGSFSRLSQIHARLNQVNLFRQGIFGFNLNNVMQSVLPSKASEFDSIDSAFALDQEVLTVRHILYDGKDIKFSAAGKVNLALHTLDLDVAGVTPRVSNSVLGGKLGEFSREITLQKLLDGITMHKLEKLPSIPLIGGIAGGPEVFTCRIVSPYDQPKAISQSIEKSFHWLHGHN